VGRGVVQPGGPPDARLFARDDREWFKTDNWRNRHFYTAGDALEIARRRPYDLRHSFVSLMIREAELTIVELADQLGHAATKTLKTYAYVFAEYRRADSVGTTRKEKRAGPSLLAPSMRPPLAMKGAGR
jgi:integrase